MHDWRNKRILVIGDVMLDQYCYGTIDRIAPEASCPVFDVITIEHYLGGAGNVAANISSLGGEANLFGVSGRGRAGKVLKNIIWQKHVQLNNVVEVERQTTVKKRYICNGNPVIRVDKEHRDEIGLGTQVILQNRLSQFVGEVDVIVVSDYGKGVVTKALCRFINENFHVPIILDPHPKSFGRYEFDPTVIMPNIVEAKAFADPYEKDKSYSELAQDIMGYTRSKAVLLTLGSKGLFLRCDTGEYVIPVENKRKKPVSLSGAGDVVAAVMALGIASGMEMYPIARLANLAASIAIQRPGTCYATLEELMEANLR